VRNRALWGAYGIIDRWRDIDRGLFLRERIGEIDEFLVRRQPAPAPYNICGQRHSEADASVNVGSDRTGVYLSEDFGDDALPIGVDNFFLINYPHCITPISLQSLDMVRESCVCEGGEVWH
jgi:hypothetical protein